MASKNQVTLTFAGDDRTLAKTFDKVGAGAKDMAADMDSAAAKAKGFGTAVDRAGSKVGGAEGKFMGTADVLDGLVATLGIPGAGAVPFIRGIGDVAGGLDQLTPIASGAADKIKNFSTQTITGAVNSTKAMVTNVARQTALWATMAAKAIVAAGRIALAWVISMGPAALVVAAVAGAVVLIVRYWDQVKAAASAVWGWVRDRFTDLKDFFVTWAPLLLGPVGLVIKYWGTLKIAATDVKDWVGDRFTDIVDFVTALPGKVTAAAVNLWGGIKSGLVAVRDWVSDRIGEMIAKVTGIPGRIKEALSGAWDGLKSGLVDAYKWIKGKLDAVIGLVKDFLDLLPGGGRSYTSEDVNALGRGGSSPGNNAMGGIITRPELSWVGEAGAEAIIPLTRPRRAAQVMRQAGLGGGGGGGVHNYSIRVTAIDPTAAASAVIEAINSYERRNGQRYARI